ncbi:hypothetical protein NQZ68_011957 [Dissostichus eleginoides]|nr:hypothetical protein NQZ68_011957 [Dissostichus eleginoides]
MSTAPSPKLGHKLSEQVNGASGASQGSYQPSAICSRSASRVSQLISSHATSTSTHCQLASEVTP